MEYVVTKYYDDSIRTTIDGCVVDNLEDLESELNSMLNNGFKLKSVDGNTYTIVDDEEQLMYVKYVDLELGFEYHEVVLHSTANLIRAYYGGDLTVTYIDQDGEQEVWDYSVNAQNFTMVDLRRQGEAKINHYKSFEKDTNFYLRDAIEEDANYY